LPATLTQNVLNVWRVNKGTRGGDKGLRKWKRKKPTFLWGNKSRQYSMQRPEKLKTKKHTNGNPTEKESLANFLHKNLEILSGPAVAQKGGLYLWLCPEEF